MEEDHVTKWLVGGKSRARPWLRDGVGEPAFPALSLRVPWGRNSVQGKHLYSCRGEAQSEGTAERGDRPEFLCQCFCQLSGDLSEPQFSFL